MTTKMADAEATTRGSEELIEKWLGERRRVTRSEIKELVELARINEGELVDVAAHGSGDDTDDWCGTMWFRRPKPKLGGLLDTLLERGWNVTIFPKGIPNPRVFEVVVRNQARF